MDPRVALTGDKKLIESSGIQNLGGKTLKNHATIVVQEDLVTWESSHDKCTFFRTKSNHTNIPCTKCNSTIVKGIFNKNIVTNVTCPQGRIDFTPRNTNNTHTWLSRFPFFTFYF